MKRVTDLLTALVFISLVVFISCNKGDDGPDGPTPEEEQATKLRGTWTLATGGAQVGSTPRPEWEGLTANLQGDASGGTIAVSGVPSDPGAEDVWPTNSSWTFGSSISEVVRDDGVTLSVLSVTENSLRVTFTIAGSGRIEGFDGNWSFNFEK